MKRLQRPQKGIVFASDLLVKQVNADIYLSHCKYNIFQ